MPRFEVTGCATDNWSLQQISEALQKAGARRIRKRHAFGWPNQPHVATFEAESESEAIDLCDRARRFLDRRSLPALLPYRY